MKELAEAIRELLDRQFKNATSIRIMVHCDSQPQDYDDEEQDDKITHIHILEN